MSYRLKCRLLGCVSAEDYPACHRCGAGIYEDFFQAGQLDDVIRAYWLVRRFFRRLGRRRCEICGRRYWPRPPLSDEWTCSDECFSKWLPF